MVLNIATGDIVYWGGGYPAGKYNDLKQARMEIVPLLPAGEKILSNKGYNDQNYFIYPTDLRGDNSLIKKIMGRQKT